MNLIMDKHLLAIAVNIFVGIGLSHAQSWADVKGALASSITDDSFDAESIRPVSNVANNLAVSLDLNLAAINEFDESNGYLEISGYLTVEWTAEAFTAGISVTEMVKNTAMWKPSILLVNSLKKSEEIGSDSETRIRYNFLTKECMWKPWFVVRGACTPNVQYYPFDKQSCSFKMAAWGYTNDQVLFTPKNSEWTFNFFEENGEWQVDGTSSEAKVESDISLVEFKVDLTRRPLYYIINLLAPVIVLGIVNVFVFLLPADSGERIGFSVTCFLAYVVMLNTIMDYLPSSAAPLSYLSYYTFVMMVFSAAMSLGTIFSIRIHLKSNSDDPVPSCLQGFFKCLTCAYCYIREPSSSNRVHRVGLNQPRVDKVVPVSADWDINQSDDTLYSGDMTPQWGESALGDDADGEDSTKHDVTWTKIAAVLDLFMFLAFLGGQIFYTVAYLLPLFFNA